jgi:hypothetical protein
VHQVGNKNKFAQKFVELDREVAELREQISRVANNTIVQPNHSTLSDTSPVQPSQSGNNAVSEPCTPNLSCMIESGEMGCSHGMNGNVLNGNVCSMTLKYVSANYWRAEFAGIISSGLAVVENKALYPS